MVENEAGCEIKKLISDNGTEYAVREFKQFWEKVGIQHQLTGPYTSQQSRMDERSS